MHMLHLATTLRCGSYCGAPKGQAASHFRQPMQSVESMSTTPLSARFQIAPVGQAGRHAGSAQWLQDMLILKAKTFGKIPPSTYCTRRKRGPASSPFLSLQAISQARQPMQSTLLWMNPICISGTTGT